MDTVDEGKERCTSSQPIPTPIPQGMLSEVPSNGTMAEPKVKSGILLNEDKSEDQTVEAEASILDATTEDSEEASPSSERNQQQETSSENNSDRCSICGKNNCPLDPARKSKMSLASLSKTPGNVRKLKSPVKSKSSQLNVMMLKRRKTSPKRSINTRSLTKGLVKRMANHSSLHIFKLKAQLFKAVENGDLVRVQELIQDTGAAVRRNKTRCTLLHAAASHNQPDVVMFLQKLISPSVTNKDGQTPAHVAAEKGHVQVLKLLMSDSDFDADKGNSRNNAIKSLLGGHLFKAVLEGNKNQIKALLELGADPDSHGGSLVNGLLARELGVTTPRLLATALNMDWAVTMFAKNDSRKAVKTSLSTSTAPNTRQLKVPTRQFPVKHATTTQGGADVYKIDKEVRGCVRIFNFGSFKKRSDLNLQQLDYDARIMENVFENMGYTCDIHSSLTAQQTKEVLNEFGDADVSKNVGCAIFVISGYSTNGRNVLTSDLKYVDIDYILNFFKDSECPQLKNKAKLFIFNLYNTREINKSPAAENPSLRLTDPLNDIACIYSNNVDLNCIPNGRGTSFNWALCRTLADHAGDKELGDLYREFLKEYNKSSPSFSPELSYFGFTKRFYFNPTLI
ncbi:uncharacterized protein LOC122244006 [Penaeus japonicus]|uniref:uncharacterized protein LOC122244006 n=1 Tax=Penaeus japonicus TaxID=27405 RepID=UPI001C714AB9|nr:uncharacterized protein LOC122244006 [Penaeus japonicus]